MAFFTKDGLEIDPLDVLLQKNSLTPEEEQLPVIDMAVPPSVESPDIQDFELPPGPVSQGDSVYSSLLASAASPTMSDAISTSKAAPKFPTMDEFAANSKQPSPSALSAATLPKQDNELVAAQDEARKNRGLALLLKGAHQVTAGANKAKEDTSYGDELLKMAGAPVEDVLQKRKASDAEIDRRVNLLKLATEEERNNPNSPASKMAQSIVGALSTRLKIDLHAENAPLSTIEKMLPGIERYAGMVENAEARKIEKERVDYARRESLDLKKQLAERLSDKQTAALGSYENAIKTIDDVIGEKEKFDTGPAAGRAHTAAAFLGFGDAKKAAFKSTVGDTLAQYIKSISGAAVSENERRQLIANLPTMNDQDDVFIAKAEETKKRLMRLRDTDLAMIKKQGKNVKEFETSPSGTEQALKEAVKVKVQLPDGRVGLIPKENLEKAVKQGAKVVE